MQPNTAQQQSTIMAANTSGAMFQMYSSTFGNMNFMISPSMTGEVSNTFQTIPYISLESIIYAQQINAQTSPVAVLPGQNTGQQNIQGSYTIQDGNGLNRMVMGYNPGGF